MASCKLDDPACPLSSPEKWEQAIKSSRPGTQLGISTALLPGSSPQGEGTCGDVHLGMARDKRTSYCLKHYFLTTTLSEIPVSC